MKIVFVTTQSPLQSTLMGRVMPLAQEFGKMGNDVTILVHREMAPISSTLGVFPLTPSVFPIGITIKAIGTNPFHRTANGKKRHSGLRLIWTMMLNALRVAWQLIKIKPDVVIIVKPLPENTLAVLLAKVLLRKTKIILDVDDFELEANHLTSLIQRAAIHWSERTAVRMASHVIVATPFLGDHMQLLAGSKKPVTLIPTGLPTSSTLVAAGKTLGETRIPLTPSLSPSRERAVEGRTPSVFPAGSTRQVIVFAGSVSISSGHRVDMLPEVLLHVRKTVPDATLIIAGSGDDEEMLHTQFAKLGLQDAVTWHGRFTMNNLDALMQDCTVLIDPIDTSIANRAKSSFRSVLALTYGIPCITSNVGIRTDMIPKEFHGRFFAIPADVSSYSEKVCGLFQNPLTPEEQNILAQKASEYQYEHLAKIYYNCII